MSADRPIDFAGIERRRALREVLAVIEGTEAHRAARLDARIQHQARLARVAAAIMRATGVHPVRHYDLMLAGLERLGVRP